MKEMMANSKVRPALADYVFTAGAVSGLLASLKLFEDALTDFQLEEDDETR